MGEIISDNISIKHTELITDKTKLIKELRNGIIQRDSLFLLIIPTYNEIENIKKILNTIESEISVPIEVIIVDDNSPDGTADAVLEMKHNMPNLHLLKRSGKMGLGSAYLSGFQLGYESGFKYLITMDSDLSHPPEVINRMAVEIDDCDVVIGSRYCPGGFEPFQIISC